MIGLRMLISSRNLRGYTSLFESTRQKLGGSKVPRINASHQMAVMINVFAGT
jgi:hypothetical protein